MVAGEPAGCRDPQGYPPHAKENSPGNNTIRRTPLAFSAALLMMPLALLHAAGVPQPVRPKLQFINGSSQTIDIVWLKSDTERVPNGSVAPGKDAIISTTFGHRFEVVGRDGKAAAKVISKANTAI